MENVLDRFCTDGDVSALLELTDYDSIVAISIATYALTISNPPSDKTIPRAQQILNTLVVPPPNGDNCSLKGLSYVGDSCYLDSSLMALFAAPNMFVHTQILAVDLKERTDYPPGKTSATDLAGRKCMQKELIRIANSVRGHGKNVKNCTNLRAALKGCPHIEEYHLKGQRDSGEFLVYILSQFPTNIAVSTTTMYGVDGDEIVKTSEVTHRDSSIVVNIDHNYLEQEWEGPPIDIGSFLSRTMDSGPLEDPLRFGEYPNAVYYFRTMSIVNLVSSPFLVFQIQRKTVVQTGHGKHKRNREVVLDTPVFPTQSIITGNGDSMSLSAIVVWESQHYTSYIRCGYIWYSYNDIGGGVFKDVGTYKDMLKESPCPITQSTLVYYAK
jgi:ubiquitin C-terminal hydrolase